MTPTTQFTAATPAQKAQDLTQIVHTREHTVPEPTSEPHSPPSHSRTEEEEEKSMTHAEVRVIAYEAAELAVMNILQRLNLMLTPRPMPIHEPEPEPTHQLYRPMPMYKLTFKSIHKPYTPRSSMKPIPQPQSYTHMKIMKPKNIGYFEPKLYFKLTVSDTEHEPVIHDVFLFTNQIHELSTQTDRSMPIELSL